MQYFRVFSVLYVYGNRFNMNTKARSKLNQFVVSKKYFSFHNDITYVHALTD